MVNMTAKFEGVPLDWGFNYGGVVFIFLYGAISQKLCKIELSSQPVTNSKSYIGFQLEQQLSTLNDFECQLAALSSVLCGLRPND